MKRLLYIIALILLIGWALGLFAFNLGYVIHILLVLAIISLLLTIIKGDV